MAAGAVLAFVAALSRADWRVLDLGPLYALAVAVVLGAGHGLFWFWSATGRALRARFPARLGSAISFAIAIVVVRVPDHRRAPARRRARFRRRDGRLVGPAPAARGRAPARPITTATASRRASAAATATTRAATSIRAPTTSRATASTRTAKGATRSRRRRRGARQSRRGLGGRRSPRSTPRADAFKGNMLVITIDALRGDRLGVAGYGRPAGKSLTPTLDALARKGTYFKRAWSQAPNTPQVVPVDPDRGATRPTSRGTSRGRTTRTCCPPTTPSSRRWRPRA